MWGKVLTILCVVLLLSAEREKKEQPKWLNDDPLCIMEDFSVKELYGINSDMTEYALTGMKKLYEQGRVNNDSLLVLIDFNLSSDKKRFFVLDVKNNKVLYKSHVAHGKNSGREVAMSFSNVSGSKKSCFGFFTTGELYKGKFDLALKLDGLEYCNYNARPRGIVIHKADYANPSFLASNGMLGRSYGCPALPTKGFEKLVKTIENGVCVFAYYDSEYYFSKSKILK